jgi:NAD(P)-dependent dehydrogenase (short-subunit alcohol dehydrogenase family)
MSEENTVRSSDVAGFLKGQVVLITGAGRGLGRSLALAFAAAGASVAANDLTPVNLDETIRLVRAAGGTIQPFLFDIAKGLPARALVDRVIETLGRVDILVNNAGVRPHFALAAMDEWDWQRTMDVNLTGPFLLMQAVLKPMQEQGGGVILNIAGGAPLPFEHGMSGEAAYFASKSALVTLSQAAAEEFSAYNIRVHTICPGESSPGERVDLTGARAQPGVDAALLLCSPGCARVTGQVFWLQNDPLIQEGGGS